MKSRFTAGIALVSVITLIFTGVGCVPKVQYDKLVLQNSHCNERVEELLANQEANKAAVALWQSKYKSLHDLQFADNQKIKALQASLDAKNALIADLTGKLGETVLPVELSSALSDWALKSGSDMVEYDEKHGLVRFKSDLTFDSGKDSVKPDAQNQIIELSKILNSQSAQKFDILIVGHTDDQPIKYSAAQHPTNWHLSAHRAIAVERILETSGVQPKRMAIVGMGQYRPIAPNLPGHKGNPKNRRVEIYIVPAGKFYISNG